jgi:hypothetical protein
MRTNLAKRLQGKTAKSFPNSGFTLMELMVAATMTTAVVAAAGYGVASMISTSTASTSRSERRAELSRSNDFIATEIREGSGLVTGGLSSVTPAGFDTSYTGKVTGAVTKVLMVNPPTGSTPIVYFVATPTTGSAKGPRALYRWGPAFNNDGTYSSTAPWVSEVLVDQIQPATAPAGVSYTAPSCSTGLNGDFGFATCVDSLGKSAQIFQNGKISKVLGASENYEVKMSAGSRRTSVTVASASFASGATTSIPFTIINGGVEVLKTSKVTVETLSPPTGGGSGYPVPTSIRVAVKPKGTVFTKAILQAGTFQGDARSATSQTYNIAEGNTISIAACSNNSNTSTNMDGPFQDYVFASDYPRNTTISQFKIQYCPISTNTADQGNISSYTNYANSGGTGKTVFTLKNGDEIPSVKPATGQSSAAAFLSKYADSTGNHLKLASNQVIYLFEFATLDKTHQYHDLQDTVVLVTFN